MNSIFFILPWIIFMNTISAFMIWRHTRQRIHKLGFFYWVGSVVSMSIGIAIHKLDPMIQMGLGITNLPVHYAGAYLIAEFSGRSFKWKTYLPSTLAIFSAGLLVSHFTENHWLIWVFLGTSTILPAFHEAGVTVFNRNSKLPTLTDRAFRGFSGITMLMVSQYLIFPATFGRTDVMVPGYVIMVCMTVAAGMTLGASFLSEYIDRTKQLEGELKLKDQATISGRAVLLGELSGGIAHEIASPLAVIQASAELTLRELQKAPPNNSRMNQYQARTIEMVGRIQRIIKNMRALLTSGESAPKENVDVDEFIQQAFELCSLKASKKDVKIKYTRSKKSTFILGRSTQLVQVISNLVNNGIDAVAESADPWVEIETQSNDSHVFVSIIDSGHGIPPDVVPRLFEFLFTTKDAVTGTGLGLHLSKRMAEEHGGTLEYDPSYPHTRFVLKLPLAQALGEKNLVA